MKKIIYLISFVLFVESVAAQIQTDTLAFQDFEVTPAPPVWTFTGPVVYNSGYSSATAAPPNSPIGIGGSQAWESTQNSSGLVLTFANVLIPAGYDSIRVRFNLAAMNLTGSSGGPDDLDYVRTEISTDTGATYYSRLRIRGAIANNSFWEYAATGVAKVDYLPATEALFQPTNSGPQTTEGYSTCEIVFPGSVPQIRVRITGRSSTSTDTWLIDNLVITGEFLMTNTTEIEDDNHLSVYPNPTSDVVELIFGNETLHSIQLCNTFGEVLQKTQTNTATLSLNISNKSQGIYFITLTDEEGKKVVRKIVKM